MTKQELEATEWAKEFKKEDTHNYLIALRYALSVPLRVSISRGNEDGKTFWEIAVIGSDGFLMDTKKTKKEAISLCNEMNWSICK